VPIPHTEVPGHLQAALASRGLRLTHQRRTILSIVETAKQHLDAAQILRHARKVDPGIDRVTVYRTLKLLKRYGLVDELDLMHMQGEPRTMQKNPHYQDVVTEVADFFRQQYSRALECGVDPMAIAFDPGIGFGKTLEHNVTLLKNLERLRVHDRPLVVGVSRKSFLGKLVGTSEMSDRLAPTIAFTSILRARGGDVVRVHDVKENVAALRVAKAMQP